MAPSTVSLYEIVMLADELMNVEQLDLGPAVDTAREQAPCLLAYAAAWDALVEEVRKEQDQEDLTNDCHTDTPKATYSLTVDAIIDGLSAPLAINASSVSELRKAVRLLQQHGMLVPQCPLHHKPMKQSQYGGFYCTSKNSEGEYCKEKVG